MSLLESVSAALPALDPRTVSDIDQEILVELEFHLEMRTLENLRAGLDPDSARSAAIARFGDFNCIRQQCRRTLLGERLMLQKLQAVLTVALLSAVAWLAYQVHAGQRATETALADFAAAVKQLAEKPPESATASEDTGATIQPAHDWRKERPVVVGTFPETGAADVDVSIAEIRVTFSKQMADENWSWVRDSEHKFPESTGDIRYEADGKTCVMPVKLKPNTNYVVWLNTANYQNFKDREGRPAVPYLLKFTTAKDQVAGEK